MNNLKNTFWSSGRCFFYKYKVEHCFQADFCNEFFMYDYKECKDFCGDFKFILRKSCGFCEVKKRCSSLYLCF